MPRSSWRAFVWVCAFATVGIVVEGLILAGRDVGPPTGSTPAILAKGQISAHRWTTKSWSLEYDHAQMSPDGSYAEVDGIHNGVLYRNGKPYLSISAMHVTANTLSMDFTATGRVHIAQLQGAEARSFDTDLITWTNVTKMLTLAHPSIIKTGNGSLTVDSASLNFATGAVHLGRIRGAFTI
ncbi:MAG: hypothetical protein JO018_06635 [Candidatus Eremiobacteraeota bacterium]|nr:hypothetical protein [Candidatus Eremiobacteraeota bacterium]